MSDSGSNNPYDPDRPSQPEPPQAPQWGANPPSAPGGGDSGEWTGGQLSGGQGGSSAYGSQPGGQEYGGQPGGQYGGQQFGGQQYGQPGGTPPPNYLVWAILSTVLCCLPLGIASIVYAAQVNGKYASGDVAGAQESSRKAKRFAIWSAIAGLVVGALYLVFVVLIAANSDTDSLGG